jgi:hypothetical protein
MRSVHIATCMSSSRQGGLQASVVSNDPAITSAFVRTASYVPLVLTGENTSQQQKLVGIRFGALDFLEKPVAVLKLRNVWQHTVRKVSSNFPARFIPHCCPAPAQSGEMFMAVLLKWLYQLLTLCNAVAERGYRCRSF